MCILLHRSSLRILVYFRQIVWMIFSAHSQRLGFLLKFVVFRSDFDEHLWNVIQFREILYQLIIIFRQRFFFTLRKIVKTVRKIMKNRYVGCKRA